MDKQLVMTLVGPDQIGIVDRVSQIVFEQKGNVEESRMARLGGEFAMLLLVSVPDSQVKKMETALSDLNKEGLQIFTRQTGTDTANQYKGWIPYRVSVTGADHEGIVNSISRLLAENNINVEAMDTDTSAAPMSGTILFSMTAIVVVPPDLSNHDWRDRLDKIADEMNLDIDVSPYKG